MIAMFSTFEYAFYASMDVGKLVLTYISVSHYCVFIIRFNTLNINENISSIIARIKTATFTTIEEVLVLRHTTLRLPAAMLIGRGFCKMMVRFFFMLKTGNFLLRH